MCNICVCVYFVSAVGIYYIYEFVLLFYYSIVFQQDPVFLFRGTETGAGRGNRYASVLFH